MMMDRRKLNGRKSTEDTRTAAIERLKEKATTRKYVYDKLWKIYKKCKVSSDMIKYMATVFCRNNRPDLIKKRWRDEHGRYTGVNSEPKPINKKALERPRDYRNRFTKMHECLKSIK